MDFDKSPKTVDEQIELLRSRGMIITDVSEAQHYLAHLHYYRLSSYWLPFEDNHDTHQFRPNTNFKTVLNLYIFDRELRLLVLNGIERAEVSWRTQWAYEMSLAYDSHCYTDKTLARNISHWEHNFNDLEKEVYRSQETFIKHYLNKYDNPPLPPIWAISEVMSIGLLSRWYKNLKPMFVRKAIARKYQLDNKILESLMHHLTEVRNVSAHHSRLWNRKFTVTAKLPHHHPSDLVNSFNVSKKSYLYNSLVFLIWLLNIISPNHSWRKNLLSLINQYHIDIKQMGFPNNYLKLPIWK